MNKVYSALQDLQTKVQSIAGLEKKVFISYDPEDLARQITATPSPCVGAVYEGMRSVPEQGTSKQGLAVVGAFSLYLVIDTPQIGTGIDQKVTALTWLDSMRKAVLQTTGPGGHHWRFAIEALADASKARAVWVQRWDNPFILER